VVSFAAARQNDRVGLLAFSDRIELFVPAKKGITHVLRIVREILSIQPAGTGTDLAGAMRYLNLVLRRRATVFLISDFLCGGGADDVLPWWSRLAGGPAGSREAGTSAPIPSTTDLRMAARRHDLIAASIFDPREAELPPAGMVELEDAESGRLTLLDTGSRRVRRDYERRSRGRREALSRQLRELGIDEIPIRTDASWVDRLVRFFRMRERRAAWA
ncbi:MAG: VWA domain-containing protein, partial [Alphaproteobacteria bacterium]|nr:VWA domain-containing protein [Alphaproteobacteria bacterium]